MQFTKSLGIFTQLRAKFLTAIVAKENKKFKKMNNWRKIKLLSIVHCSLFIVNFSFAQINSENLENNFPYRNPNLKKIQFSFNAFSYVYNREYFNNIADGYTQIGYWLNPKIAYQPADKVLIEGGVFLRKEIGNQGLTEIEPTFTVKIKNKNWSYLFGNLEGNISHKLVEPLMNFERVLVKPLEHGLQAKYRDSTIFFDTWLDYQIATTAGKSNQEHFFGGFSFYHNLLKINDLQIKGIAQTSIFHEGGQNLVNNILPVRTLLNPALGLSFQKKTRDNGQETRVLKIKLETYYVGYFEGGKNGNAFYGNFSFIRNNWQFQTSFFYGNNFISPFGSDLYQSASREFGNQNYYENTRSLLFLRAIKDWKITEGMFVSLRFEPYFDLKNHLFEHSEGIYLKYGL